MPWKLRKGYILVDPKGDKPRPDLRFLADDHPWVEAQKHKLEPCNQEEVDAEVTRKHEEVINAELQSIDDLDRATLIALHKQYIGEPDASMTVKALKAALKKKYRELRDEEDEPVPAGDEHDDPELSESESTPPKSPADEDSTPKKVKVKKGA